MIIHTISLIGHRDSNEDQHDIILNINNQDSSKKNLNYLAVYDGHGGKEVSKYLKNNLSGYFLRKNISNFDPNNNFNSKKKYINKVFSHIQNKLEKKFKNFSEHVGSTALVVLHYKNKKNKNFLNVINLGDCRAVLCNKYNIATPMTKDHKPHLFEEKKRIEKMGGKVVFDGGDFRIKDLSVSRAFGDLDAKPFVSNLPEIFKYEISTKDKFIIIACDGLWDVIENQDAVNFVLKKLDSQKKIKSMSGISENNIANELAKYAINNGSYDNVSIIIAFL